MSDTADSVAEAVQRLSRQDPTLELINLYRKKYTDADVSKLVDLRLTRFDFITHVCLSNNRLTDETGVKLARYVAASSTVISFSLDNNRFGAATYLAVAEALRVNTSLRELYLYGNQAVDESRVDAAFIDALRVNPNRPFDSEWHLYTFEWHTSTFKCLQFEAKQQGHPTLQMLLGALYTF